MSATRVPPARPRLEHQLEQERVAYKRLVRGELTAEQYLAAITPRRPKRRRRWLR